MSISISIIIPSYKPQSYLWECLDSLRNQTLTSSEFEVLLVLNGCCEPYRTQIERYILKCNLSNIHLIQTDISGVSNARNMALEYAKGKYICFIDDDDIVSRNYLLSLLEKSDNQSLVVADVKNFTESVSQYSDDYISKAYWKLKYHDKRNIFTCRSFFSSVCCKMIPRDSIESFRFNSNLEIGEDTLFMFAISKNIKKIELANDAIYYRRCRSESAFHKKRTKDFIIRNSIVQMCAYFHIYICNPLQYNFFFFLTRIMASILHKNRFILMKRKIADI